MGQKFQAVGFFCVMSCRHFLLVHLVHHQVHEKTRWCTNQQLASQPIKTPQVHLVHHFFGSLIMRVRMRARVGFNAMFDIRIKH